MAPEDKDKKPVKGDQFLKRVGAALIGNKEEKTSPEDEAAKYKKMSEAAEAKAGFVNTMDQLNNPPSVREMQQKQIEQAETARQEAEKRAREADERDRDRLNKEAEAAAQKAAEEEQQRKQAEQELRNQQTQMLLDKLEELRKSQKPLNEQLNEYLDFAEKSAARLGFEKPGKAASATSDPHITLEIEKMRLEDAQRQREHELRMAQDKKEWDLKLLQLEDERAFKKEEIEQKRKTNEMFTNLPEVIGGAIAKGLIDHGKGVAVPITQRPLGPPKSYTVSLGEGESGDFECPNCHAAVAVAPTSTIAQCAGCNARYPITRSKQATQVTKEPIPEEE
jgi:hypothetical protein